MRIKDLEVSVNKLAGVGPKTAALYKTLGIETVFDLIATPPRGYEDRTKRVCIGEQQDSLNQTNTVVVVLSKSFFGPRLSSIRITVEDTLNGRRAILLGFNRSFLDKQVFAGSYYSLYGNQILQNNGSRGQGGKYPEFSQFEIKHVKDSDSFVPGGLLPVYGLTANLTQNTVRRDVKNALSGVCALEPVLPFPVTRKYRLTDYFEALRTMHAPRSIEEARTARRTLAFTELFYLQLSTQRKSGEDVKRDRKTVKVYAAEEKFIKNLPYSLTADQEKVLSEIREDMASSGRMNRLLQGDVGCGKTLVAWISALHAISEGRQVAFMAPTELLARQHASSASVLFEKTGVNIAYLDGTVHGRSRTLLLKELESGNIDLLIGTHALFSKDVVYRNLGYVIIDEQHRFGVEQRNALFGKGENPDVLLMTATPIPRTLALTMYGNLNVSFIKIMPAGRLPVKTFVISSERREEMFRAVEVEFSRGHQAYFVYPRIEAEEDGGSERESGGAGDGVQGTARPVSAGASERNPSAQDNGLKDVETMYEELSERYSRYRGALIHSRLTDDEKIRILSDFAEGKLDFLVATSVVEVGIDVKNATCMVVENAGNFGLSALHQLRGRVGRSSLQSWCFLVYDNPLSEDGRKRLSVLRSTTDGFVIAEEDLKIRGPGEITGLRQSGFLNLKYARLDSDIELMAEVRDEVSALLESDSGLIKAENAPVRENLGVFCKGLGI